MGLGIGDSTSVNLEIQAQGRIFARSLRAAASDGLLSDGLLDTSPSAVALMGERLIGFGGKEKTMGKS